MELDYAAIISKEFPMASTKTNSLYQIEESNTPDTMLSNEDNNRNNKNLSYSATHIAFSAMPIQD